ncbi:MAG: hypothetical protein PHZ23_14640 [Acidiphilium sp.]|nr:hypothetical protein [Acidiphilium sp.]
MTNEITKFDDIIDSRDVIARLDELADRDDLSEDEQNEIVLLESLKRQGEDYAPDWERGAQLVRDSYFKNYAQVFGEVCGIIDENAKWPHTCIDWDKAAYELRMDYTAIEFGDVTYWIR